MNGYNGTTDSRLEYAYKMLLNEHTRWNQWALFFLGGLIAIGGFADKAAGFLNVGNDPVWALIFLMGLGWSLSSMSIKRSTWGWIEAIKKLEQGMDKGKGAWILYKAGRDEWIWYEDFLPNKIFLTVTNWLFFVGLFVVCVAGWHLKHLLVCCCA